MAILLPVLIGLVPLLITPGILFHYDIAPKIIILALAMSIALLRPRETAAGLAALRARPCGRWLFRLAVAEVLWFGFTTALSSRPSFSLFGTNWRRMGLLTVLSLAVFVVLAAGYFSRSPSAFKIALRVFAVTAILASIYGIAQYFDVDPLQPASAYHAQAGDSVIVRPPGTLGHADYFGWWLAIAVFAALALERADTGFWRWVARAAYVFSGVAILASGTRAAIVAVAAGFVCLVVFSGALPARKHLLTGAALIAALALFYISPAGERLRARVQWSANEPLGGARPLLWKDSLRMAAARPFAGFGPETFPAEFPRYQSTSLARLLPDFYYESPHNTALDALVDQGIPGLFLAAAWISLGFYVARRAAQSKQQRSNQEWTGPLAAGLAASCVAAMFGALTLGPAIATALLIAMLVAAAPVEGPGPAPPLRAMVLALSIPVALCLTAYALALAVSESALARFEGSSGVAAIELWRSAAAREMPGAAEDLYGSKRLSPICLTIPGLLGRLDCLSLAGEAARHATVTADNPPNAWYNLAIFAATQNDSATLESALRTSIAAAPNWFKPHWSLANYLALTGRTREGNDEAVRAAVLDAGKDPEVAETLKKLTK